MKKELLNESEIRKMMKFANLQPLTTPFIEKLEEGGYGGMAYQKDDEEPDMLDDPEAEADPAAADAGEPGLDMGPDAEAGEAELPAADMDMDMDMEAGGEDVTWNLTAEQAEIISPVLEDLATQVREMAEGGEEEEAGDPEASLEEPEEEEAAPSDMMAEDAEALEEDDIYVSEGKGNDLKKVDLVNEVARRVAQRLIKARQKKRSKK